MMWQDLLYFSKGERRAFILLLCLITVAFILLLLTDRHPEGDGNAAIRQPADTIRGDARTDISREVIDKPAGKQRENLFAVKDYKRSLSSYSSYPKTEKYPAGTVVELNSADSLTLKKVPGIGSVFSRRIIRYRALLGGFHSVAQLSEVYGIDAERYEALKGWFIADPTCVKQLSANTFPADSLAKHPYISYRQARAIYELRGRKGKLSGWENLSLLEEFTEGDRQRIAPYLSFE